MYPKRGQITLFIIIGVLVIAVFLAVIFSVADVAKKQVKSEAERIGRAALPREFIRIYIDDCLNDAFTRGLVLLGRQGGKIWQEQGGRVAFEEGVNGLTLNPTETYGRYSTGRVAYGIKAEEYFHYPNAYPCNSEENAPEFCQYHYPDTETGFGSLILRPGSIESELSRFLRQEAVQCILNYNEANFSYSNPPEIIPGELQVGITIREGGISVNVEYPLEIRAEGGPSFALEPFHDFYSSKFKQLLDAAITFPLQWDQKFVDFEYREETLTDTEGFTFASPIDVGDCIPNDSGTPDDTADDYFACSRALHADKYNRMGLEFESTETSNGDDVFIFRAPPNEIVRAEEYEFRIARQNRPPALDYIHRNECLSEDISEEQRYDYLVIKDDEELGGIDLKVTANEPDEEQEFTSIVPIDGDLDSLSFVEALINLRDDPNPPEPDDTLSRTVDEMENFPLPDAIYTVKALAQDVHGAEDWQLLRILIDRPLEVGLRVIAPYRVQGYSSLEDYFGPSQIWLSKEDPFALAVNLPEAAALDGTATVTLKFTPSVQSTPWQGNIQAGYNANAQNHFCFLFPGGIECPSTVDLENAPTSFLPLYSNQIESLDPDTFLGPFVESGELEVAFSFPYCGVEEGASDSIQIAVKECIPHRDENFPFPYVPSRNPQLLDYLPWFYQRAVDPLTGRLTGRKDTARTPFEASNVCCDVNFEYYGAEHTCFTSPYPGCFGLLEGDSEDLINRQGLILETLEVKCDEERGNICDGTKTSSLYNSRMTCGGDPGTEEARAQAKYVNCNHERISEECRGKDAFSFQAGGICFNRNGHNDDLGCRFFSGEGNELVDNILSPMPEHIFTGNARTPGTLNDMATSQFRDDGILSSILSRYHLGCDPSGDNNKWCDKNFDGYFEGVCDGHECKVPLDCEPNKFYCDPETDYKAIKQCNDLRTRWITADPCGSNEYCSGGAESRRERLCQQQICAPGEALCYNDYLALLSSDEGGRAVRERRQAIREDMETDLDEYNGRVEPLYEVDRNELAAVCNSRGSQAEPAVRNDEELDVIYDCGAVCADGDITVVNIGETTGPDAGEDWVCRPCGPSDSIEPNNRHCKTIGGGTELKVCKRDLDTGLPSCLPR